MNENLNEVLQGIICRLKKVSKTFKIFKEEGGDKFYFIYSNEKHNNIVFNGYLFTVDYSNKQPIKINNSYSVWSEETLNLMSLIADINMFMLSSNIETFELIEVFNEMCMKDVSELNTAVV